MHSKKRGRGSKRLERLLCSGLRPEEDLERFAEELRSLTGKLVDEELIDAKTRLLKALASETRLMMLRLLSTREMCVCELTIALDLTQPNTSHHLNVLENMRLVQGRKDGRWVFYNLARPELVQNLFAFLELPE